MVAKSSKSVELKTILPILLHSTERAVALHADSMADFALRTSIIYKFKSDLNPFLYLFSTASPLRGGLIVGLGPAGGSKRRSAYLCDFFGQRIGVHRRVTPRVDKSPYV